MCMRKRFVCVIRTKRIFTYTHSPDNIPYRSEMCMCVVSAVHHFFFFCLCIDESIYCFDLFEKRQMATSIWCPVIWRAPPINNITFLLMPAFGNSVLEESQNPKKKKKVYFSLLLLNLFCTDFIIIYFFFFCCINYIFWWVGKLTRKHICSFFFYFLNKKKSLWKVKK